MSYTDVNKDEVQSVVVDRLSKLSETTIYLLDPGTAIKEPNLLLTYLNGLAPVIVTVRDDIIDSRSTSQSKDESLEATQAALIGQYSNITFVSN